ncbi:MAG: nucleotidyltransferase domain-containing protein [Chloroflexi bacterium]|nr:nucleotidyltransferase domain-containing protein [Chloroflexota bacterium]MCC6896657.1 nucleotidyltransferase domain-containing protein [Anaerolineae bacterium]
MNFDQRLYDVVAAQPYPLLFITISGAHLYGFPSPDSDYDLRGSHILPVREIVSLNEPVETVDFSDVVDGLEIDLVTHDLHKYFNLLLKRNGYVLEQICSPLVIHTTPEFEELRSLVPACLTRHHAHHYFGFVKTEWRLFSKENPHRVKPLLYVFRVLLTGIHLMKTGQVESNLVTLNDIYKLPYIPDLIARKLSGAEQSTLPEADTALYESEYLRLTTLLEVAFTESQLPESPTANSPLNDLLVRLRLKNL